MRISQGRIVMSLSSCGCGSVAVGETISQALTRGEGRFPAPLPPTLRESVVCRGHMEGGSERTEYYVLTPTEKVEAERLFRLL
jgi:hypothetical protein